MLFDSPPQAIAILRLSSLGDVCQLAAVVAAMREQVPAAKITWIIGRAEAPLLQGMPGVEFIVVDKKGGRLERRRLRTLLRGRRFDVLCHMQVSLRASLFARVVSARYVLGFDRQRARDLQWLFTNRKIPGQPQAHVMQGFLSFARELGFGALTPQWGLPTSEAEQQWAVSRMPDKPWCVIVPAGSYSQKNWLVDRYAALTAHVVGRGFQVLLCGGPSALEQQLAEDIMMMSHVPIHSLVGQTTLPQLSAVLARATVVVSPDTGPLHMASSQGTAVIGLYGITPPARTGPYRYLNDVVSVYEAVDRERHGVAGQKRWGRRHHGDHIMARISLERVVQAFDAVVERGQLCPVQTT